MLPDYHNGSIVNLMSSIAKSFRVKTLYNPLKILPPKKLKKNIVLIVIDGLGYNYLKGKNTILNKFMKGSMTSVFPSTTGAAIPTFFTGVPAQQHAFTGWFVFLKEIGVVAKSLPFSPRLGGPSFSKAGIKIKNILTQDAFTSKINAKSFIISGKEIADSDFSKLMSKKAKMLKYKNLNEFFSQLRKAMNFSNSKKYVYAYWSKLDSLNHNYGVNSKKSEKHLKVLIKKLNIFIKNLRKDTTLIITSDHGFVNTPKDRVIKLEDHPKLKESLTLPLCGESRTVYCYVHPSKADYFEKYVKENLSKYCNIYKSPDLIGKNYFGLFKPNPNLFNRVGDYILICKENYIIKDKLENEKRENHIGHHSGISEDEMLVPLIVVN